MGKSNKSAPARPRLSKRARPSQQWKIDADKRRNAAIRQRTDLIAELAVKCWATPERNLQAISRGVIQRAGLKERFMDDALIRTCIGEGWLRFESGKATCTRKALALARSLLEVRPDLAGPVRNVAGNYEQRGRQRALRNAAKAPPKPSNLTAAESEVPADNVVKLTVAS